MLLILLVFLMKFVDISILNRARSRGPNVAATRSSSNSSSSGNSSACSSNSSSKENCFGNINLNSNEYAQYQQRMRSVTPQQVQQLRHYQHMQQQQLLLLQRELSRRQKLRQQNSILKSNQCNVQQNDSATPTAMATATPTAAARSNNCNVGLHKGIPRPKSRRGMTEFSSTNENQKSHLPQLNHNSSHYHLQHHNHHQNHQTKLPLTLPTAPHSPNQHHHQHQQQHQQQQQQQQQQSQNHYKRPLTSPNNSPFNNFYGHGFPLHHPANSNLQQHHHPFGLPSANTYLNDLLISDDELTDECLKKNVQIVLNNLDRYNNALRSIIVNGGGISNHSSSYSSFNNNLSNISNMASNMVTTPESDYNSNATTPHHHFNHLVGLTGIIGGGGGISGNVGSGGVNCAHIGSGGGPLNCSIASSHDFTHDNSDYQWFLDYGYRDGVTHQSVLSSLSASYHGIGELSYYEDFAKNIDANLAEVDMESFRAEDIHSLLSHIPSYHHHKDDDKIENSICKSELLFSPVKESHISIDSLDLDAYPDDGDIILTCKANKDNYTIAFEGSVLYSDESFYAEPNEITMKNKQNFINLHSNLDDIVKRKSLEVSMSRSDHAFTTWSKLKKSSTSQLQRYPSGNNNTSVNIIMRHAPHCTVRKSSSLPNLRLKKDTSQQQLNVSQALSTSTVESCKSRNLLPMCQMPISTTSAGSPIHFSPSNSHHDSSHIDSTGTNSGSATSATNNTQTLKQVNANQPAFNLVKLFIKQKSSCSSDTTCMDVSSGCWPSSEGSSSLEQRIRKKSMNDSGKGSALSRHDEEEDPADSSYQLDSLDICDKERNETANTPVKKVKNDLYREVFEMGSSPPTSPAHRKIQPLKNPQVINLTNNQQHNNQLNGYNNNNNNNNSSSEGSRTSENLTQVYNDKRSRMKFSAEMISRSMQTSARDRFRFVPPSFLAKLQSKVGEEKQAPIYVIYPNYALPDLGFVKTNTAEVIFTPFNYKNAVGVKKRPSSSSVSEDELLKNVDYKHVVDWKSLATLLPAEYRRRLKHIPEVDIADLEAECSMKPLFCMTPPIRRTSNRANVCDCAQYFQMTEATATTGAGGACTSSSGSSQPPSSGYRGSSTLLTDSEFENPKKTEDSDPLKNMYVYQYENNRMEGGLEERSTARTPRGILRKNPSRLTSGVRTKRSSLIEDETNSNVRNLEKRRSLQEPVTYFSSNDDLQNPLTEEAEMEEYYDELHSNLKLTQGNHRLSRKDMDARTRAENFLSNVPKSELKYYAEIANILESVEENQTPVHQYDAAELKKEVSRALSQKKVSFNQKHESNTLGLVGPQNQRFTTPPNSPNISMASLRMNSAGAVGSHRTSSRKEQELNKISSNRFKRLQIQWELLSKDSSMMLKDLACEQETKSGGSTPTSANAAHKSRIPRPVSYPAGKKKVNASPQSPSSNLRVIQDPKSLRSPSRIVPPKRYSVPTTTPAVSTAHHQSPGTTPVPAPRARTPNSRTTTTGAHTANTGTNSHPNTPKRRVQSPRTIPRVR